MTAHDFAFTLIDGNALPLDAFRGQPVLVVNTASACGYTPQYAGLQTLHERYAADGLVVVAVPSNDFGDQEPGNDAQIAAFCASTYGVGFPLTRKEHVIGAEAHPFFRWIADELGEGASPRWNFHKALVDGDGALVGLWPSAVSPLDAEIIGTIEPLLATPAE